MDAAPPPASEPGDFAALEEILGRGRDRGLLGPGDLESHLDHARAMALAAAGPPRRLLDLGSGGGIPGLALLVQWPKAQGVLLDAGQRRTAFLRWAVEALEMSGRAEVVRGRAETLARRPGLRGSFDLVAARRFGSPAVTAECAVGFLARGGLLVVAEPPEEEPERWPSDGLATLGLAAEKSVRRGGFTFARFRLAEPVADRWPRRAPHKHPLW